MILSILAFVAVIALAGMASIDHEALASQTKQSSQNATINGNTVQQSSVQSSSTVTNSSIVSSITRSIGDDGIIVDLNMSGRIVSAEVNATTGRVEAVLFGNWSLKSGNGTSFAANFTRTPFGNSSASTTEYGMGNLRVHSAQQINNIVVLDGRIDITSNGATIENASTVIIIRDGTLLIGFERETQAATLFKGVPIVGFEQ